MPMLSLNQFTGKLKIFSPLVRMPVLSNRRVFEIRKSTGESGNRNWNPFAGSISKRSTRHYVGRQGTYLNFLVYINFPFTSICTKYQHDINFAGGGRRLFRLQGNERDARLPHFGTVTGGSGGRGVSEKSIKISSFLRFGHRWLFGKLWNYKGFIGYRPFAVKSRMPLEWFNQVLLTSYYRIRLSLTVIIVRLVSSLIVACDDRFEWCETNEFAGFKDFLR